MISNKFLAASTREEIEAIAAKLSAEQILKILGQHHKFFKDSDRWKISPLFAGISQFVFIDLLSNGTDKQMDVLKKEVQDLAIQHHLTLLVHNVENEMNALFSGRDECASSIRNLEREEVDFDTVNLLDCYIARLAEQHFDLLHVINRAQQLVWLTDRSDLIDKFSSLSERLKKSLHQAIESRSSETGLSALLDKVLFSVYGNQEDPNDKEALYDGDPAIDGLERIDIREISDLQLLGLIPKRQLKADKIDQLEERNRLFQLAAKELAGLGLKTIGDLKQARIFSKQSLKNFIKNAQMVQ